MTDSTAPARAGSVVVVGAGRVGLHLARSLVDAGREVAGVVVRSDRGRGRAAALAPGVAALTLTDPAVTDAGTLVLCVADDDLAPLVRSLIEGGAGQDSQLVVHTSGRYGLSVLDGLTGPVAAIHPVMTFTGTAADDAIPPDLTYGVTGVGAGLAAAVQLVRDLGGRVELIPDDRRALYHAAVSHAVNHLNTLVADATDLLRDSGVDDPEALLGPIARASLANALSAGTASLTGPVVRGDRGTVGAHLRALEGRPALDAYRAMALRTSERAEAAGRLPSADAEQIRAVLASGG